VEEGEQKNKEYEESKWYNNNNKKKVMVKRDKE
jgi:hypothetical protein